MKYIFTLLLCMGSYAMHAQDSLNLNAMTPAPSFELSLSGGYAEYTYDGCGMGRLKASGRLSDHTQLFGAVDVMAKGDFGFGLGINAMVGRRSYFYTGVFGGMYSRLGLSLGAQAGCVVYFSKWIGFTAEVGLRSALSRTTFSGTLLPITGGLVFAL